MAFESLTDKLSGIIKKIKGHSRLTSENMDEILREIRVALLEADVNYRVVKEFINEIKEKAIGEKVYDKLNPSEMVVKIVRDELVNILGSGASELNVPSSRPCVILMAGLQGSGKTTTAAKLANFFKNKEKRRVLLAACDIYRPGASEQLSTLAKSIGVDIITRENNESAESIARRAKEKAFFEKYNYLIIDTAGRLQIDETLMIELENIKKENNPDEVLLGKLRIVHRDLSPQERQRLERRKVQLVEVLNDLEKGELHPEDLDESIREKIMKLFGGRE